MLIVEMTLVHPLALYKEESQDGILPGGLTSTIPHMEQIVDSELESHEGRGRERNKL